MQIQQWTSTDKTTVPFQQAFINKSSIQLALVSTEGHSESMIIVRRQEFKYYYKSGKLEAAS